jgi:hypothetical protein
MRRVVLALLAVVPACNWFFGLNKTKQVDIDAQIVPDVPPGHAQLTWWNAQSHPYDTITFPTIDGLTKVQIGAIDGPLVDVPVDADGRFEINQPEGTTYRIVYLLPGDPVPHEVQWGITEGVRLAVPVYGRMTRTAIPTGSKYTFTVGNATGPYPCLPSPPNPPCISQSTPLAAFTTGTWMYGGANYKPSPTPPVVTLVASTFSAYAGAVDDLSPADADTLVVLHYDTPPTSDPTQSWIADGYAAFPSPNALQANTTTDLGGAVIKTINDNTAITLAVVPQPLPGDAAIQQALGGLYLALGANSIFDATVGVLPDLQLPAMSLPPQNGFDRAILLPLAHRASGDGSFGCVFSVFPYGPDDLQPAEYRYPVVLYREYRSRPSSSTPGAPQLPSGFQVVAAATKPPGGCTSVGTPPTPLNLDVALASNANFTTALSADHTPITLTTGTLQKLTFDLASVTDTNDCVITAYRIDTSSLVPLRTVQTTAKMGTNEVYFPTDDFQSGATHVFGMVCRNGFPRASIGDYTVFGGFPQIESQVYPGSFTVSFQ